MQEKFERNIERHDSLNDNGEDLKNNWGEVAAMADQFHEASQPDSEPEKETSSPEKADLEELRNNVKAVFEQPNPDKISEENNPNSTNQEIGAKLLSKITNQIDNQVDYWQPDSIQILEDDKMSKFSAIEIPEKYLNQDRIVVNEEKQRFLLDIKEKQKDERQLESILSNYTEIGEARSMLTPELAGLIAKRAEQGKLDFGVDSWKAAIITQALPLKTQEKIFASKSVYDLIDLAVLGLRQDNMSVIKPDKDALKMLYKAVGGLKTRELSDISPNEKQRIHNLIGEGTDPSSMVESVLKQKYNSPEILEKQIHREAEAVRTPELTRDCISEYLYGMGAEQLGTDLVALGAIQPPIEERVANLPFGATPYLNDGTINAQSLHLNELREEGMTPTEEARLKQAVDLFSVNIDEPYSNEKLLTIFDKLKTEQDENTPKLKETLEGLQKKYLQKASINLSESMKQDLEKAEVIGTVEYGSKKLNVLSMGDNDYSILVHRLGAYRDKNNDDPAQWIEHEPDSFDQNGHPIGYVSTSTLTSKFSHLAASKEDLHNPDEIYYAFTDFGKNTIQGMSEYDLYTNNDDSDSEKNFNYMRQNRIYKNIDQLVENTEAWRNAYKITHNEVVLDRYSNTNNTLDGRLLPNYLVTFTDDISKINDTVKKHAAFFGVDIIMNPNQYDAN